MSIFRSRVVREFSAAGRAARTGTMLLSASLLALGCGRTSPTSPAELPAARVSTVEVQLERVPEMQEVVGTVRARTSAVVAAKVMAAIRDIPAGVGATVHAGDQLVKLDDRELRAEFERARGDYERFQKLLEQQAATRAEFDAVQSRYRVAETALSYANVQAPFDGIIAQKFCEVGDLSMPGKPLFLLEQPGAFRLEAEVPERFSAAVATGQNVAVVIDATGDKCTGTIGEVVPATDPATRTFIVKIDLAGRPPLKSGMFGRAQLATGERSRLLAPVASIHEQGQLTFVFVASEGRARLRLVKPGKTYADRTEILAGLQPGERVVVDAPAGLADGQRVAEPQ